MDFIIFMEKEILEKKRQGKIKTAKNYQATRNTLVQFLEDHKRGGTARSGGFRRGTDEGF